MADRKIVKTEKTVDKIITIKDSQEQVDFWSDEISNYFNWKHELLEEYRNKYPEIEKEFREKRKIDEYKFASTPYRPCSIMVTDGKFYRYLLKKEFVEFLEDKSKDFVEEQNI